MPGACLSLWPTEECKWSTWDIWRSSDIVQHALYIGLALMLAYTFFVLIRFLRRCYLSRHELRDFKTESGTEYLRNRKMLIAELSLGLGTLKSIASTAPFLGLAGTSYGILAALWFSYSGSPERYIAILFTRIAFAFTTTLSGILVATPAAVCHSLLRARIESFTSTSFSTEDPAPDGISSFQYAQTLPLKKRFSGLPPFALLAAPALASVVCLFTPFHPYRVPTGLRVLLPSFACQHDVLSDRIIVLRVTKSGELFINAEPVSFTDLPRRLSDIYRTRARRDLYLLSDNDVSFQTVADAIDTATKIRAPEFNSLDINVLLITPQAEAESEKCFALSLDRLGRQFLRQ
ncbi:MAG TPA: MotA/TolQ/ExbB proton channel family protein [Candidatus Dormibacteraeota bacterium]|nr:MotA/TolQ/ExbB proton channel family protein [Candidatus Dormibacteraeota bacterium]